MQSNLALLLCGDICAQKETGIMVIVLVLCLKPVIYSIQI